MQMSVDSVRWTRETCGNGETCPRAGRTSRGTKLVQGYPITDPDELAALGVPDGEIVVEVPDTLLPEV